MLRKTTVRLVTNANVTDSIQEMITGRAVALSVPKTEVILKIHLSHTGTDCASGKIQRAA